VPGPASRRRRTGMAARAPAGPCAHRRRKAVTASCRVRAVSRAHFGRAGRGGPPATARGLPAP
jgi:hypothetical protein